MKEFIIFVCIDSTEIFFSKLRYAGLNYNLLSFFTDSYCVGGGGVSNKKLGPLTFSFRCPAENLGALGYWAPVSLFPLFTHMLTVQWWQKNAISFANFSEYSIVFMQL